MFITQICSPVSAPGYDFQFQSLFPSSRALLPSSTFYQSGTLPNKFHRTSSMDSLLTLRGLPPLQLNYLLSSILSYLHLLGSTLSLDYADQCLEPPSPPQVVQGEREG